MFSTVANELCRAANIFAAHCNEKSAFWGFVGIFGLYLKVLHMKTKYVSKFLISRVFTSDKQCPKYPNF